VAAAIVDMGPHVTGGQGACRPGPGAQAHSGMALACPSNESSRCLEHSVTVTGLEFRRPPGHPGKPSWTDSDSVTGESESEARRRRARRGPGPVPAPATRSLS
jgi:hypothetical protein